MIPKIRNMQKLSENDNLYQKCGNISKNIPSEMDAAPHCLYCFTLYTVQTAIHCWNSSVYAYIYCKGRLERYWNGLISFWSKSGSGLDGVKGRGYPLDCYDCWSTCSANMDWFQSCSSLLRFVEIEFVSPNRMQCKNVFVKDNLRRALKSAYNYWSRF